MKKILFSAMAFAVVAVSAVAVAPTTSEAVPSFARQTGAACNNCHFQSIPLLSTFGRNFSMSGMRDMGEGALIEDDHLSLPASFDGSFLMKVLIRNTDGLVQAGNDTGIQLPDESAIFIGGRYGEHLGGLTEISVNGGGGAGVAQAKLNYVWDTDFGHVNLSMVGGDVGLGVLFSDPSNAVRHTNRSSIERATALELSQMMKGSVTGFGLSAFINDAFYIGGALYSASDPGGATNPGWASLNQINPYLRAAWIAELGGMETVVGAWWTNVKPGIQNAAGGMTAADALLADAASSAQQYGLDLQLQGDVGDVSVGFYLPWVIKGEMLDAAFGNPTLEESGFQAMLRVGFGHMGINLGYDYSKRENIATGVEVYTENRPYIGGWYSVAQNVELILAYTSTDRSNVVTGNVGQTTFVVEYVY